MAAEIDYDSFVDDQQTDRRVHGGQKGNPSLPGGNPLRQACRAVSEIKTLLVPGSLGENISTPDMDETTVHIGDIYRLGNARLQVCQPRNPLLEIDRAFGLIGWLPAVPGISSVVWRVLTWVL